MITNMSQLVISDAAATPVAHVFTPASRVAENIARWVDREHNNGLPIGYRTVTMSVKEPTSAGGVYRVKLSLALPKLDASVPTKPVVTGVGRVNLEYIFPDTFDDQDRKDAVEMTRGLVVRNSGALLGDNVVVQSLPY